VLIGRTSGRLRPILFSRLPAVLTAGLLTSLILVAVVAPLSEAAPGTQSARPGLPNRIAVVGDSISAGTGTEGLNILDPDQTHPNNSWSTGTNNNSLYLRLLAINPSINGNRQNASGNGKQMTDADDQVNTLSTGTDLVTIQMGGNDLCKDSVGQMTSVSTYRNQFVQFLSAVRNRMPNALILVASVPDIFNLWYVRGAPGSVNGRESSRAGTARTFWDNIFGGFVPCRSLITNPTSTSASDTLRRNQVRQRNIEFNYVLEEECAKVIRCRFDDWAAFDLSSNRNISTEANRQKYNRSTSIADWGNYEGIVPPPQWGFVDDDVSTADHFHPSNSGHRKLAEGAWETGYDFDDRTYPQLSSATLSPAAMSNGISRIKPTVTVNWSDAAGIRGVEYRVRTDSDGGGGSWLEARNTATVSVPMSGNGISYLESRAFDMNGNRSASTMTRVEYDPAGIPNLILSGVPPRNSNLTNATIQTSLEAGLTLECSLNGASFSACPNPIAFQNMTEGNYDLLVRQTDGQGNRSAATSASWTINLSAPPAPILSGIPAAITNARSVSVAISSTPGHIVECSYNEGAFQECVSPWNLGPLAPGEHRIAVREKDLAGNIGAATSRSWVVDIDPPGIAQITNGPPAVTNRDNPTFEFTGEDSAAFECRLDRGSTTGSWQACTSPWTVSNATTNGFQYVFRVRQTDEAGNKSVVEAQQTWRLDRTSPVAPQASGAPNGLVPTNQATLAFQVTGNETGSSFECSTNESAWAACQSPLELTDLPQGPNSFSVRQVDWAGNRGPATSFSWQVKSVTDSPLITTAPAAQTNARDASITFIGEPLGEFACSLDGGPFTLCSSPWTASGLPDGEHTMRVRQTDALGTTSTVAFVTWEVDGTPPAAPTVPTKPGAATNVASQTIAFTGEPGGPFSCRFGGGEWTSCTSPFETGSLPDGNHRFEVRQTDGAGNTGPAAVAEWQLKTTKPEPPAVSGAPSGTVRSKIATMTVNGEAGARIECRLNGAAWASCPSPMSITGLAEGTNRMEVRQVDLAGNESDIVSAVWAVDTIGPKLKGKITASRSRKATVIRSGFDASAGRPARAEYSTASKSPPTAPGPASSRSLAWAPSMTVKGSTKVTWVRVFDPVGNASPWYPVR
jgi:lysophospholipase L1-like esterase